MKSNRLLFIGSIVGLVLIIFILFAFIYPDPPVDLIERARNEIALARREKAKIYAEKKFNEAEKLYSKLLEEWKFQNSRFFLFRNFSKIENYSLQIIALCQESRIEARDNLENLSNNLRINFEKQLKTAKLCDTLIKYLPFPKELIKNYTKLKLSLLQSYNYYKNAEYKKSENLLNDILENYKNTTDEIIIITKNYFKDYNKWLEWYDNLVKWSKENKAYAILVDKMAKICRLYNTGKVVAEYPAELGRKWMGNKHYQGDNATPEGKYKIIKKLGRNQTKYYKAFLLNYPNEDDKKRFNEEKKKGNIPVNAKIGGLIEIHGEGGKGIHWTNGCVALNNHHMDELFNKVGIGTPVLIVGSLKSLKELFDID